MTRPPTPSCPVTPTRRCRLTNTTCSNTPPPTRSISATPPERGFLTARRAGGDGQHRGRSRGSVTGFFRRRRGQYVGMLPLMIVGDRAEGRQRRSSEGRRHGCTDPKRARGTEDGRRILRGVRRTLQGVRRTPRRAIVPRAVHRGIGQAQLRRCAQRWMGFVRLTMPLADCPRCKRSLRGRRRWMGMSQQIMPRT